MSRLSGFRSALLALLAAPVLGACQQPGTTDVDQTDDGVLRLGSVEAVDTVARAVAPNDRPLVIDGFRGRVDLEGAPQETAELRFVRRGRGADAAAARGVLEDVTITESGSEQNYTYTLESTAAAYAAVDVIGTVPREATLRIERSSGPVVISGVRGALTVRHEHGPVTLRDTGGPVDVEIRNGDVEVQAASLPADGAVRLRTSNGDVTLRLPPDASAQISAETSAGALRTRGLALTDERFDPQGAGGRYEARLGAGATPVELRTENGSVLVAAAEPTALDTSTAEGEEAGPLDAPRSDTTVDPQAPADTVRVDTAGMDTTDAGAIETDTTEADTAQP
ncbi:MAG: DUF4097 family beta strand repeat-containing protein [Salinibacter sp.]